MDLLLIMFLINDCLRQLFFFFFLYLIAKTSLGLEAPCKVNFFFLTFNLEVVRKTKDVRGCV